MEAVKKVAANVSEVWRELDQINSLLSKKEKEPFRELMVETYAPHASKTELLELS